MLFDRTGVMLAAATTSLLLHAYYSDTVTRFLRLLRVPKSLEVKDCGEVDVKCETSGGNILVTLDWDKIFGKLPFKIPFCSGVITPDGTIYISGTIGLAPPAGGAPSIVTGGPKVEAIRTMELIEANLKACGAGLENVTMAHVYLVDNTKERFAEMNAGYLEFWGARPLPARITVGCSALALGCSVEIDVVAKM